MTVAGIDAYTLVRRYEPVLRFTAGELFFPMPAEDYLAQAALWWAHRGEPTPPTRLVDHGQLDCGTLAKVALEHPNAGLYLRYAPEALRRKELKAWRRRPHRPEFKGGSRLAAVGLIGRLIDSGMRLSLTLRGKVPGGLAAAAEMRYASGGPPRDAYHAYVTTDGGYIVIQYWYLYAMNDWRSTFSGVNDHESDWEQVSLYLAPAESDDDPLSADGLTLAWLAFSSHDDTGDELRRRSDDPDITWADGTHPVVNAGAGSHSGAYLAGDYLVRVQPPALGRIFAILTMLRGMLFPWTRNRPSLGLGIPYIDYRRGDGESIGPGTARPWTAILIDDETPWVRDYRGLWGLDTADPFGGERAPGGPRYARTGAIRAAWADPVGWAGLDKVPPTRSGRATADRTRITELDGLITDLSAQIEDGQDKLRRAAAGIEVLPRTLTDSRYSGINTQAHLASEEAAIGALRTRRRDAINERDQLRQVGSGDIQSAPHAHLRQRAVPDEATAPGVLARFWAGASLSVLLIVLGLALVLNVGSFIWVATGAALAVSAVEALLRGRLPLFLLGVIISAATVALIWLFFTNLRMAFGVLALIAAVTVGVANLRNVLAQRHS